MDDLEREKDLEEDEFKTSAKPSTSRAMTTRICKRDVMYRYDVSYSKEETSGADDLDDDGTDEEFGDNCDGYSSPDYELNYEEENLNKSPKKPTRNEKKENESENLLESTKNCTKNEDQENVEEFPKENPICILLDQRNGQKRPVGITELQKMMKEANFGWNYTRLPLPSDFDYDPGCEYE